VHALHRVRVELSFVGSHLLGRGPLREGDEVEVPVGQVRDPRVQLLHPRQPPSPHAGGLVEHARHAYLTRQALPHEHPVECDERLVQTPDRVHRDLVAGVDGRALPRGEEEVEELQPVQGGHREEGGRPDVVGGLERPEGGR
jgi:hypothetical protein